MNDFHTLDDFDLRDKTVILRVDINCPLDQESLEIKDDNRIQQSLVTIKDIAEAGGKVVILAHQGRKGEWDFISMKAHCDRMSNHYGLPVRYVDDISGENAKIAITDMVPGEVIMLRNIRDLDYERKNRSPEEHAISELVTALGPLADLYVCDAFATAHRSQCSMVGFTINLPSAAGRLLRQEVEALSQLIVRPERPTLFIFGGTKFGDAIDTTWTLLKQGKADKVALVGLAGMAFLMASGIELGKQNLAALHKELTPENLDEARELMRTKKENIILPVDVALNVDGERVEIAVDELPTEYQSLDIGSRTVDAIVTAIDEAGTVFMSGPAGMYERPGFELGTRLLLESMANADAFTVVGGGHTANAVTGFGLADKMSYVSTAGGALEAFILGETLPAIDALKRNKKRE